MTLSLSTWLAEGPWTLTMSSGFFGFYAHCGALAALEESGFRPSAACGSSAGALITGLWSAGLPAEAIARELTALKRADFWDPRPGFGVLRGRLFDLRLRRMLPVQDFARCRIPFAASVYDVLARRTVVLRDGDLASVIRASCSVPFMFHPVWIGGRPYLDGGILDRPGIEGLPEGERTLYHHLLPTSFWRKKTSPSVQIPTRTGLRPLVVTGLPAVTPFKMEEGPKAFERARAAVLTELGRSG